MYTAHPYMESIAVFERMAQEARAKWRARPDRLTFQAISERDEVCVQCQFAIDALHDAYKADEVADQNAIIQFVHAPRMTGMPGLFMIDPPEDNPTAH